MFALPSDVIYLDHQPSMTDSQMIQNAVNLAKKNHASSIIIPSLNPRSGKRLYEIEESILLPSDITVYLENCYMVLKDGVCDNIFRNENMYSELFGMEHGEQRNISIIGIGHPVLDGIGHNDIFEWSSREQKYKDIAFNNLIIFHNVDGFEVRNIEMRNLRWWGLNLIYCSNGIVSDITIRSDGMFPNQDGIMLRYGCHHIVIERISGNAGGDFIALSAIGGESYDKYNCPVDKKNHDIHNIVVRDIIATSVHEGIITLRCHDESKMYNILIEDVIESNYDNQNFTPYGTILIGQNYFYRKKPGEYASMNNITIRNVYTKSGGACITLGNTLVDSTIENINVSGCKNAITTINYEYKGFAGISKRTYGKNGIKLSNVKIDGVHLSGILGGIPIDFDDMRDDDFIDNLEIINVTGLENDDLISYQQNTKNTIRTKVCDEELVKKIDNYLKNRFSEDISLDEVASAFGLDKYRLSHLYKIQCNTTVMNALKKIRIDNARTLLKVSSLSIREIATMCGFESSSYFIKVFKSNTGCTPNDYRKINKIAQTK